jgi:hypothetical protein
MRSLFQLAVVENAVTAVPVLNVDVEAGDGQQVEHEKLNAELAPTPAPPVVENKNVASNVVVDEKIQLEKKKKPRAPTPPSSDSESSSSSSSSSSASDTDKKKKRKRKKNRRHAKAQPATDMVAMLTAALKNGKHAVNSYRINKLLTPNFTFSICCATRSTFADSVAA